MLPVYSADGKAALPTVAKAAYKLFVYFEDEGAEYLYEEILKRLRLDLGEIRVLCLRGKDSLLEHRAAEENLHLQKKILYVLDKDFDDLLQQKSTYDNVHYLERYSIENFLIEEEALNHLALEEKPTLRTSIRNTLQLTAYLKGLADGLRILTSLYLVAQKFGLSIDNTSEPIQRRSLDKQPWILCSKKISDYHDDVSALLILSGAAKNEQELEHILSSNLEVIDVGTDVPGKQLIDLVRFYLTHKIQVRGIAKESFCYRLANLCELKTLNSLSESINMRLLDSR